MDIQNYLHLYSPQSGLKIMLQNGKVATFMGINNSMLVTCFYDGGIDSQQYANYIKPILRPLSDMKEEEARVILPDMPSEQELIEYGYYNEFSDGNVFYQYIARAEDERLTTTLQDSLGVPEHWHFLLSKGFDLFGLIEAGLAIDSTTLNNQKQTT